RGAVFTVKLAAEVAALLQPLLNTARYCWPLSPAAGLRVRVGLVAPARLLKLLPPSVLTCHCTVGAGVPLAAAVKVALLPAHTVWPVGWVVMPGAALTVRPA